MPAPLRDLEHLRVELDRQVLTVTIDRPKQLNALNTRLLAGLATVADEVRRAAQVRAVVVTGAGGRAFVSGADVGEFDGLAGESGYAFTRNGQRVLDAWEALPVPSIAMIDGWALGGGCELAMACTMRIASDRSRLGLPEIRLGVMPGYGGTQRLPRLVGRGVAAEMMLTGEPVDAARAHQLGLVNRVCPPGELEEATYGLARTLADRPRASVRYVLEALDAAAAVSTDGLRLEASLAGILTGTADKAEGVAAFREKRPPRWSGRE